MPSINNEKVPRPTEYVGSVNGIKPDKISKQLFITGEDIPTTKVDGSKSIAEDIEELKSKPVAIKDGDKVLEFTLDDGLSATISLIQDEDEPLQYHLMGKDDEIISTINFPKDLFLKSVEYDADTKELVFVFNTSTGEETVKVDVSDLVDEYTAGNGLKLSESKEFSIDDAVVQTKLTFDDTPIENSVNPVKSGGVYTALKAKQDELTFDNVPTENSNNPVKSGGVFDKLAEKQDELTFDTTPTENSTNPIQSGGVYTALETKQNNLTFDTTPTENSTNPVTSGGVYDALETKQNTLTFDTTPTENSTNPVTSDGVFDALATKENTLTFDTTPTEDSDNPVTSDGIFEAIKTEKERAEEVESLINKALEKKANIYIRLAQGITIGNNIQGMHFMPVEPFDYYSDWTLTSADGGTIVRTDNNLVFNHADSTTTVIVQDGTVLEADYVINEEFLITAMTGSFTNVNLLYRYFDIKDLDQRIGLVSALLTTDKSSIVNAINSLKGYVDNILESSEVSGSPYVSYADFLAGAGSTITQSKYAYVTFTSTDTRPTGGKRDEITAGDTWRLDCSDTQWFPTTNMTASTTANIQDGTATNVLKQAGSDTVTSWLQSFRNNLKSIFASITSLGNTKQDKLTATGTTNLLTAPATAGEQPGTKAITDFEPAITEKKSAFNKDFGTTSGTVAQGNDSRFRDGSVVPYSTDAVYKENFNLAITRDARTNYILLAQIIDPDGTTEDKKGIVGRLYFNRGSAGAANLSGMIDVVCTKAYNQSYLSVGPAIGVGIGINANVVQKNSDGTYWLALFDSQFMEHSVDFTGQVFGTLTPQIANPSDYTVVL